MPCTESISRTYQIVLEDMALIRCAVDVHVTARMNEWWKTDNLEVAWKTSNSLTAVCRGFCKDALQLYSLLMALFAKLHTMASIFMFMCGSCVRMTW